MVVVILLLVQIFRQQGAYCSMQKNLKGFTLVELMISMAIIVILSVVLSVSFSKAQKDGRDQRRVDDLKAIQNAAELYYSLAGNYPALSTLYTKGQKWTASGETVLESYPKDPKDSGVYVYNRSNITTSSYCVCATLENVGGKNSNANGNDCSDMINKGANFCIKNQQ